MNIFDLRRVSPIQPSTQTMIDLRKNNNQKNKRKEKSNQDFNSILQDEINKLL